MQYDLVIIGGGISACYLSMILAEKKIKIALIEQDDRLLRKISFSGNGRCNFSNKNISSEFYNRNIDSIINSSLGEIFVNLHKQGFLFIEESGRLYPKYQNAPALVEYINDKLCNQKNLDIYLSSFVENVESNNIYFDGKIIKAKAIVFACGSDASIKHKIYNFHALACNENIKPFNYSLLPIKLKSFNEEKLHGKRVIAKVSLIDNGKCIYNDIGEVMFKKDELSGIPVFQLSAYIARNMKQYTIALDLFPELDEKELIKVLKINSELKSLLPKQLFEYVKKRASHEKVDVVYLLKNLHFSNIVGSDKNIAQVASGGILLEELDENLQSLKYSGRFYIGECVDVDGLCGGYNITWALMSAQVCKKGVLKWLSNYRNIQK